MKKEKYQTEEQKEVKKFIFVLLGLILVIVGIYFFTRAFITKDLFKDKESSISYQTGAINYEVAIVGNMLSKPESEYYVMAFSSENTNANYYNTVVSKYINEKEHKKVYYLDLENALNTSYIATDENSSKTFTSLEDLKLGEVTLLKIKNKKVSKMITNIEDIKKELNL